MTTIEVTPVTVDSDSDHHHVWHLLCCLDDKASVCGTPLRHPDDPIRPYPGMATPDDCIVCDDVWRNSESCPVIGHCPYRYDPAP